jgi:hypothetical protein
MQPGTKQEARVLMELECVIELSSKPNEHVTPSRQDIGIDPWPRQWPEIAGLHEHGRPETNTIGLVENIKV